MKKLMSRLWEDKKKKKITNAYIAKQLKLSSTSVTNYAKDPVDEKFQHISFANFIKLTNIIYTGDFEANKKQEAIKEFSVENFRKDNDREILEWLSNRGEEELLTVVIQRVKGDEYHGSLGELYELLLMRKRDKQKAVSQEKLDINEEFYFAIDKIKMEGHNTLQEVKSLLNICHLYALWGLGGHNTIETLALRALSELENINSQYLKTSYKVRIYEMMIYAYLKINNSDKLLESHKMIDTVENLERFPIVINSVYRSLAEFYAIKDYGKSMYFIEKAFSVYQNNIGGFEKRIREMESTHDFIKIVNGEYNDLYLSDRMEKAHLFAKIGRRKEALEILNEKGGDETLTAHQLYYKALATNDRGYMKRAYKKFNEKGDTFYSEFIIDEMEKM
jgi:hypothetical protein